MKPQVTNQARRAVCAALSLLLAFSTCPTSAIAKALGPVDLSAPESSDEGAAAITLHGRTADQLYSGAADWSHIARLVETVDIPVLGNGDIWEADDALRMIAETGCFNLSVLSTQAPFELFSHFGFQSGRDTDKFAGWAASARSRA